MKNPRFLAVVVVILGLMVCWGTTDDETPMGTAFTYQGRLTDTGSPANGLYDLQFTLYDSADNGTQQGNIITKGDLDVSDGYFTVELDFAVPDPNIFNGNGRWLEVGVRPGDSDDGFTTLTPRQKVTPTPYALYAASGPVPLLVNGEVDSPEAVVKGINTGSGHGIYGEAAGRRPCRHFR